MKSYYSYVVAVLLAGSVASNSLATNGTGAYPKPAKQYTIPKDAEYLHDRVIIRVHENYRTACSKNAINVPALERALGNLGGTVRKKFPNHQAPASNARNREGKSLVDISLIYEVKFNSPINVQSAINELLATGTLRNAEPHFIFAPSYVPNDANLSNQSYLTPIKAKESWDLHKGDSTVTIAIVDSGVRWDHPDLVGNIQYNEADPIDGIDNDGDGYVDNYRGWDLAGADYNLDTLVEDNNPTVTGDNNGHGSHVAGLAAASTDNAVGISGVGFKCRILPIKCSADNDTRGPGGVGYVLTGYEGIIYAADHGADVINCSWGGSGSAEGIIQQIIDYAIINKGSVIVAAAGNSNVQTDFLPAYANGVISVAATQNNDKKASFSNYSYKVSVSAPGYNIYSTLWNNSYGTMSGTSMASPITAGAVGIIRAKYPNYTPTQVKALLRSTCDDIYSVTGNATYKDKLGKGRINMYRALSEQNPALKYVSLNLTDSDNNVNSGDTAQLNGSFINLLNPSTNMTVTLSTTSTAYVTVLNPSIALGAMATNETKVLPNAFDVFIKPATPLNTTLNFKLTYTDGTYTDFEYFSVTVNQDYVNIGINNITTTAGSWGHLGFMDSNASIGMGFQYKKTNMLYEMSLIAGITQDSLSNCARGAVASGGWDEDFNNLSRAHLTTPSVISNYDVTALFDDASTSSTTPLGLEITQKTHAWTTPADSNYVMVVYDVKNTSTNNYNNFYLGLYADFDVSDGGTLDKALWSASKQMGYVQNTEAGGLFAGIVALNTNSLPHHYAFKNDGSDGGFSVYDGFTDSEKFKTLSGIASKDSAGVADISQTVSSGPYSLAAGETIQVAFALVGGENLAMIESAADAAHTQYNNTLVSIRKPTAHTIPVNVWPNPAQNILNIQTPAAGITTIQLYDGLGRLVYGHNTDNTTLRLNLEKYAAGVYTLKVQNKNGVAVEKIAVK